MFTLFNLSYGSLRVVGQLQAHFVVLTLIVSLGSHLLFWVMDMFKPNVVFDFLAVSLIGNYSYSVIYNNRLIAYG